MTDRFLATVALIGLTLIFFGAALWVNVWHPELNVIGNRVWDVFFMTFGGTLVILKSDAAPDKQQKPALPPAQEDTQ